MTNKFFPEIHGKFGFGCMRLPMTGGKVDIPQFREMVDAFLDAGLNYFDTAHGYLGGKSETAIRETISKRYPRDRFLLTNKLTNNYFQKEEDIRPFFDSQLEACGVEYFDFYLFHNVCEMNIDAYLDPKYGIYDYLLEQKKNGRIKPGLKTKGWFFFMHLLQRKGWNEADVKYWKEKGWTGKKRPWKN